MPSQGGSCGRGLASLCRVEFSHTKKSCLCALATAYRLHWLSRNRTAVQRSNPTSIRCPPSRTALSFWGASTVENWCNRDTRGSSTSLVSCVFWCSSYNCRTCIQIPRRMRSVTKPFLITFVYKTAPCEVHEARNATPSILAWISWRRLVLPRLASGTVFFLSRLSSPVSIHFTFVIDRCRTLLLSLYQVAVPLRACSVAAEPAPLSIQLFLLHDGVSSASDKSLLGASQKR